jgi:hypothetical protein
MQLVEVVRGLETSLENVAETVQSPRPWERPLWWWKTAPASSATAFSSP